MRTDIRIRTHTHSATAEPPPRSPPQAAPEVDLDARRRQQQQMGEASGVARSPHAQLESSTALLGRKCDNGSCLVRRGLGVAQFKRCAACKRRFYCRAHCQVGRGEGGA